MAGNLIFDEIPVDRLEPAVLLEVKPNYSETGLLPMTIKNLIIGPKLPTGTLKAGEVVEISRPDEARIYFGRGSIGAAMAAHFRKVNLNQPLYVLGVEDDVTGVTAVGKISFAGSVTNSVTLRFLIDGTQVRLYAPASSSADTLASNLAAAINDMEDLVVTAAVSGGVVTITSRHKGEIGNEIDLRLYTKAQPLPSGLSVVVTPMAGGSGNPDLQAALDAIATTWFTTIVQPWSDVSNMAAFAEFLRGQFLATSKMDALGFTFKRGSYAALSAFGQLTNCAQLVCGGMHGSPTAPWMMAAAAGAVSAFHLANDPARQLKSLVLPGVIAPEEKDQFIDGEKDNLLRRGISTFNCLSDGAVSFSRVITTYRKNNLDVDTRAWLDVMTAATTIRIRYDFSAYVGLQFPRAKLARDDSPAATSIKVDSDGMLDSAIVTPRIMAAVWAGRCQLYANNGWIDDVEATIRQSYFQIAPNDKNRLESKQIIDIMGNLMVLAGSLEFKANS